MHELITLNPKRIKKSPNKTKFKQRSHIKISWVTN